MVYYITMPRSRAAFSKLAHTMHLSEDTELLLWLEEARQERQQQDISTSVSSAWSLLDEYAALGVMPSTGRRRERFGGIE